jgi:hypothetical protein
MLPRCDWNPALLESGFYYTAVSIVAREERRQYLKNAVLIPLSYRARQNSS